MLSKQAYKEDVKNKEIKVAPEGAFFVKLININQEVDLCNLF